MITLDQCRYLLALSHHKHFGRAAKELSITQPSLSIQIQKIEEMLDAIIFDRSKKPMLVTKRGEEIIHHARKVVNEAENLMNLKNSNSKISGDFKIAIIPTLAPNLLPLFLKGFSEKYPDLNIIINELQTEHILKLLKEDRIDAGILVTPLKDNEIIERVLFHEPLKLFTSKNHKLSKLKNLKISDLVMDDLWLMEDGHCLASQTLNLCRIKKDINVLDNVRFKGGSLDVLKNLVRTSGGYTVLPYLSTLGLSNKEKKDQVMDFEKQNPVREVSIVSSRIFYKEEVIEALEQEIISNLPKELDSKKRGRIIDI